MERISDTSIQLHHLEAQFICALSKTIAEKIGSPDLSDAERRFWEDRQTDLVKAIQNIAALVEIWGDQQKESNLINEPAQELSDLAH